MVKVTKPMLATDWDETKQKFPVIAMPKIDGVRGLNLTGEFVGRSLKAPANLHTQRAYGRLEFVGFDGEVAAESHVHPDLCRITSSALSTITGEPYTLWWLFDFVTEQTAGLSYLKRLEALQHKVLQTQASGAPFSSQLRCVPYVVCNTLQELLDCDEKWLSQGYEGTIIRDPNAIHKNGRSTVNQGGFLRIKRFADAEAVVVSIVQGNTNHNEAQTNELGATFRTAHKDNLVPNGQVGTLICKCLETDAEIKVAPGKLSKAECEHYWQNPEQIVGKVIKYQHFPKGVKDKPRFPTFQSFRISSDMG